MAHPVLWLAGGALVGYVGGVVGGTAYAKQQFDTKIAKMPEGKRKIVLAAFKDPEAPIAQNLITVAQDAVQPKTAGFGGGPHVRQNRRIRPGFHDTRLSLGQWEGDEDAEVDGMVPRIRASTYVDGRVLLGRSIY